MLQSVLLREHEAHRLAIGSWHTGIVIICFGDGGVRRVPETIDPLTLELLGMRDDGQVIPDY